jgi:hypothetical protein
MSGVGVETKNEWSSINKWLTGVRTMGEEEKGLLVKLADAREVYLPLGNVAELLKKVGRTPDSVAGLAGEFVDGVKDVTGVTVISAVELGQGIVDFFAKATEKGHDLTDLSGEKIKEIVKEHVLTEATRQAREKKGTE